MAVAPAATLEAWVIELSASRGLDHFGARLHEMAMTGTTVGTMADQMGMSSRQLYRRCLASFGYGPRHLARVLRLSRALGVEVAGASIADVAVTCGYVDQAHLCRETRSLAGATPRELTAGYDETSRANRSTGVPSGSRMTA